MSCASACSSSGVNTRRDRARAGSATRCSSASSAGASAPAALLTSPCLIVWETTRVPCTRCGIYDFGTGQNFPIPSKPSKLRPPLSTIELRPGGSRTAPRELYQEGQRCSSRVYGRPGRRKKARLRGCVAPSQAGPDHTCRRGPVDKRLATCGRARRGKKPSNGFPAGAPAAWQQVAVTALATTPDSGGSRHQETRTARRTARSVSGAW